VCKTRKEPRQEKFLPSQQYKYISGVKQGSLNVKIVHPSGSINDKHGQLLISSKSNSTSKNFCLSINFLPNGSPTSTAPPIHNAAYAVKCRLKFQQFPAVFQHKSRRQAIFVQKCIRRINQTI